MKRKYLGVIFVAVFAAFVLYWRQGSVSEDKTMPASNELHDADSAASMSIKGMEIHQGQDGAELWRLTAESAVMPQQGGDIVAQKPFLTYYFHGAASDAARNNAAENDAPRVITVRSDTGDVNQQDNRIRFIGNVLVEHEEDTLKTALILYEGERHSMLCPEPSVLIHPGLVARAKKIVWDLNTNILEAHNGVDIDFETSRAAGSALMPGRASTR